MNEAASLLAQAEQGERVKLLAGGTDLVGGMKRDIYPEDQYPDLVVNIGSIPGLDYIKEEDGFLKIGALTKLETIAESDVVKANYTALAQAAGHTASPHLRAMGTIAGNICQENRCWYYRSDGNYFPCKMKGGAKCFAAAGDNRYHSVFGALGGCVAVNPSDTAPALLAFDAEIVTNKRTIPAAEFWTQAVCRCTVLDRDEIVAEIRIPEIPAGTKSAFIKLANRKTIDFPIVNCAVVAGKKTAIVLNAVAPVPYRAAKAEELVSGKPMDETLAAKAGEVAVEGAKPLSCNGYKLEQIKALVKRALLACR